MLSDWWRKLAARRMVAAARAARLRVEALEQRDVPAAILAVGAGAGNGPTVTAYDATTFQQKFTVAAYDGSFTGGVRVAVGDVDGDGTPDVITGTGAGGGPVVNVFSGVDGHKMGSFTVGDGGSRAGVTVAAADVNGDGKADIIVGTVLNGQPLVRILNFADGSTIKDLTPFSGSPGISVAAGDFNGDGTPDIMVGAGAGDAPRAVVFSGKTFASIFSTFAFETSFTGGVSVTAGDLNGDGTSDLICAAGFLGGPRVQVYTGGSGSVTQNFFAYSDQLRNGVFASAVDVNGDGKLDIMTQNGPGQPIQLKAFDGRTLATLSAPSLNGIPYAAVGVGSGPTVNVSTSLNSTTNANPLTFTVTFSRAVTGFTASDVTVTNGTVASVTPVNATTFTVTVTPTADGDVKVSVPAGAVVDASGNPSVASNTLTVTFNSTPPSVALTTALPDRTGANPMTFTATFSEPVTSTEFTASDITVTNGTVTNLSATDSTNKIWTILVTPTTNGVVTISIAAGTVHDAAGNPNTASNTLTKTFDSVPPTVTLATTAGTSTNTAPIAFTATFSEDVSGFTAADITVTNGTVASLTQTDASHFSFTVAPTASGNVSVSVGTGKFTDLAGNANTAASNSVTVNFTGTGPSATVSTLTTNDTTPTLHGTVDAAATSVLVVVNHHTYTASISGGTNWSADVTDALPEGTYDVQVIATDASANSKVTTAASALVVDLTGPTPTITTGALSPTNLSPIPVTVRFDEDVTGFDLTDVTATNGTTGNFKTVDARTFTFDLTPTADGDVTVSIAAGKLTDGVGNPNVLSNTLKITSDRTPPAVPVITGLDPASDSGTAGDRITNVTKPKVNGTGEAGSTITLLSDGTSVGITTVGSDGTWSITPSTALTNGQHALTATATDAIGNVSNASAALSVTIDTTSPAPQLSSSAADPTNTSPIPVAVDFGETVTGFELADVSVTNGTAGNLVAGANGKFTFDVTASGPGVQVIVSIAAGSTTGIKDAAGNLSAVSNTLSRTFDPNAANAPTITGLSAGTDSGTAGDGITNDTTPTVQGTGTAGATVTLKIDGNAAGTATVDGTGKWSVDVTTAVAQGSHVVTATQQQTGGNPSGPSGPFTLVIDTTAPTVAANALTTNNTTPSLGGTVGDAAAAISVTLTDVADANNKQTFTATNHGDGTWSATVPTALVEGTYTIAVTATDVAGNPGTGTNTGGLVIDTTPPAAPAVTGLSQATDSGTVGDGVTSNTKPTIEGTGEAGATVTLLIDGNPSGTATVSGTTWSIALTAALTEGNHVVTATQKDAAGNTSGLSTDFQLKIDTTAPTPNVTTTATEFTDTTTPIQFSVDFGETVVGFAAPAITVTNGAASNVQDTGNGKFTFDVTANGNGNVAVSIAPGPTSGVTDVAGNPINASNPVTLPFHGGA
jgi:hypothetical protein